VTPYGGVANLATPYLGGAIFFAVALPWQRLILTTPYLGDALSWRRLTLATPYLGDALSGRRLIFVSVALILQEREKLRQKYLKLFFSLFG